MIYFIESALDNANVLVHIGSIIMILQLEVVILIMRMQTVRLFQLQIRHILI